METRFTKGQMVRSNVTAQGLVESRPGAEFQYEVVEVQERLTAFGNFVTYVVRQLFGAGETVVVTNGHLLLNSAAPPAAPAEPALSENQKKFVRAAKRAGLDVFSYSGRGMFGRKCPAVSLDRGETFRTRASTKTDSLGMGTVVYAQDWATCRCRPEKRHRDCAYCGVGWADGAVCGVCRGEGIDGKVIPGTAAVACSAHKRKAGRLMASFEDELKWLLEALAPAADWTPQTECTVLLHGTSGRGSPRAVRILNLLADAGKIERKRDGRRTWFRVPPAEADFEAGQIVVERGVGCLGKIVKIAPSRAHPGQLSAFVKFGEHVSDYAWIPVGNLDHAQLPEGETI